MAKGSGIEWTEFHLEPGDGLHEDQPGLQALLRRTDGEEAQSDGAGELCQRVSADVTAADA